MCFKKKNENDPSVVQINKPLLIACICLLVVIVVLAIVLGVMNKK